MKARDQWVRRVQSHIPKDLERPGWKLVKDEETEILKCVGRIQGYNPIYLEDGLFAEKLIRHTHEQLMHLGTASTMAAIREDWWIPRLQSLVKKQVRDCNTCKVFATKPLTGAVTTPLPRFRTEPSRPFQHTGVDFAGPLVHRESKKEEGKAYIIIFTCAVIRAIHLEVTKSQTAEEFQRKLNSFITRKTRPQRMVSDNAAVFRSTASWIRKLRKSEQLQDYLAAQEIHWQFNLLKSPWWGGMYEKIIKEIKKTLYKTLGKTHLTFQQLEAVVMDIERHLNNRPLTYVGGDGEDRVLTPNMVMWGQDSHILEDIEVEDANLMKFDRRLQNARQHAWSRWQKEYIHGLMESHRITRVDTQPPEVGEIVLIVGEEKNRGQWKKGRVLRIVKGADGVARGVILLHKGNQLERPIQCVCPLAIRCVEKEPSQDIPQERREPIRERRRAAIDAQTRIGELFRDDVN